MTSTVHFSKVRQPLVDFQLIPTPSLHFQVALKSWLASIKILETAPFITRGFIRLKQLTESNIRTICTKNNGSMEQYIKDSEQFKNKY